MTIPAAVPPSAPGGAGAQAPERAEFLALAQTLIESRRNISPKRLFAPGPTDAELDSLLTLAAAAPDHGSLTPWRFVLVPGEHRHRLAQVFGLSLVDRDASATPEQVEEARAKAYRAPTLMVAVARLGPADPDIAPSERLVSLGAAIQNMLLGAHAMGYGVGLTSGRAMSSGRMRALLQLAPGEEAVCCVNIGTVGRAKASKRVRPLPAAFFSVLPDGE